MLVVSITQQLEHSDINLEYLLCDTSVRNKIIFSPQQKGTIGRPLAEHQSVCSRMILYGGLGVESLPGRNLQSLLNYM